MRTSNIRKQSPGSIARWTKRFLRASRDYEQEMQVPCGNCNACCRNPALVADLAPGEERDFPDAVWDERLGSWRLPKRDNGECVHLKDGRCSIYGDRPRSCRRYDCRCYLLGLIPTAEGQTDLALDAFERWDEWRLETSEDVDAMFAWNRAATDAFGPASSPPCVSVTFVGTVGVLFRLLFPLAHVMRNALGLGTARSLAKARDRTMRRKLAKAYETPKAAAK